MFLVEFLLTSQPTPRLITEGGTGVALPYLAAAINEPVDYQNERKKELIGTFIVYENGTHFEIVK